MSEHSGIALAAVMATLSTVLLSILIGAMFQWRKEFVKMLESQRAEFRDALNKVCEQKDVDHKEMWNRINHHMHNGGGRVIITEGK